MITLVMSFKLIPVAHAACDPGSGSVDLGECLKLGDFGSGQSRVSYIYNHPSDLVRLVVNNMFAVAGIVLFVMILLAGWNFILKGKDGVESAKKIITTALIGFVIMFSAYWLVQIISLVTGVPIQGVAQP